MARVTKPGGWIVELDSDWGTLSFDTTEVDIEQRLKRFKIEHCHHNGFSGRQLYRLFKQQQLQDVSVEMCPLGVTDYSVSRRGCLLDEVERDALAMGVVTADGLQRWHTSLEEADAKGIYYSSVDQVMVSGRKP
jgi:hypothetical protein